MTQHVEGDLMKFDTGAVRSADRAKVRYDLISPIGIKAWAEACAEGAEKYGDFNWELGFPANDILNHVLAHIYAVLEGDRSENHLGHAIWGVGAAIHSLKLWPHLNENMRSDGCKLTEKQKEMILAKNREAK